MSAKRRSQVSRRREKMVANEEVRKECQDLTRLQSDVDDTACRYGVRVYFNRCGRGCHVGKLNSIVQTEVKFCIHFVDYILR